MKILLADVANTGHHNQYLSALIKKIYENNIEYILIGPLGFPFEDYIQLSFPTRKTRFQYFLERKKWISTIFEQAENVKADVVHFLTGDVFCQLGGWGFGQNSKTSRVIITQHHAPIGTMRKFLFMLTSRKATKVVVHTQTVKKALCSFGVAEKKVEVIDYPVFHFTNLSKEEARKKLSICNDYPVLLALGGTRFSKGLDIILEALKNVKIPFCLVVAGEEEFFSKEFIDRETHDFLFPVVIRLEKIPDKEFGWYLDASDCVVVPYRNSFDGASGPMVEAIWRKKIVIGPSHGSIGNLIKNHNFGFTFETENPRDLAKVISEYLQNPCNLIWTNEAEAYRQKLSPDTFSQKYLDLYKEVLRAT